MKRTERHGTGYLDVVAGPPLTPEGREATRMLRRGYERAFATGELTLEQYKALRSDPWVLSHRTHPSKRGSAYQRARELHADYRAGKIGLAQVADRIRIWTGPYTVPTEGTFARAGRVLDELRIAKGSHQRAWLEGAALKAIEAGKSDRGVKRAIEDEASRLKRAKAREGEHGFTLTEVAVPLGAATAGFLLSAPLNALLTPRPFGARVPPSLGGALLSGLVAAATWKKHRPVARGALALGVGLGIGTFTSRNQEGGILAGRPK